MTDFQNPITKIIKRAWLDPEFKAKLLENPKDVLAENGIEIEEDDVRIYENTENIKHLVLPKLPEGPTLTDFDFERMIKAGATCDSGITFKGTCL